MYRSSEVAYLYSSAVSAELDVVDGRVLALDGFQLLARPEVVGGPVPEVAIALTFVALIINPTPYSLSPNFNSGHATSVLELEKFKITM